MITKTDFLVYLEAPRHFWALKHNQYDTTLSEFDKHLIQQGYLVEKEAKEFAKKHLLPNYSQDDNDLVMQKTFIEGGFEARSDILIRNSKTNKWDIFEVKSVTKPEPEHYYDTTFQAIVMGKHLDIGNIFILHVNNEYVRQGDFDLSQFLIAENVNVKVQELKEETLNMMKECQLLVSTPNYKLATECYKPKECRCKELCFPNLPDDSIYNLSRINEKKITELREMDILDIKDIPDDYKLTTNQKIQVEVAKRNTVLVDKKAIKADLASLSYPIYFLDYETYDPAIPMFDGYKPYQQMVFQYSLHVVESADNTALRHYEYVVKDTCEPCRELVADLQSRIGKDGSVIVWLKAFECTRNNEMGEICTEFKDFLEDLNNRVYDLMDIFKNNLYVDPKFKGSNSIKDVLPVLVPELSYKTLNIHNGSMAMVGWYKMVYENSTVQEKAKILKDLLTYCEQDTLAMVRIWEFLNNLG